MRFFRTESGQKGCDLFKKAAQLTAEMHRCTVEFGPLFNPVGMPVINDEACAKLAQKAVAEVLPEGSVVSCDPWFASESFSRYLDIIPGVMAHLGIGNPEKGSGAPHHNVNFDIDEDALPIGVMATVRYATAYMQEHPV